MGSPNPPVFEAIGLSKRYPGGVLALSDVDIAVRAGETMALIGESGSGKTTLMRVFNRMVEPDEGVARFEGRDAAGYDPIALRRRIGYVQQGGGLIPHWTVARNVALTPWLLRWPEERRRERADAMLELVGLEPETYGPRFPAELSGGQRQRAAFARALAGDPDAILLDEPFGALDAITRRDIQNQFLLLKRELGKTALLVTHDLDEAFRLADRIAVMKDGRVLQIAAPAELAAQPAEGYVRDLVEHAGLRPAGEAP